MLSTIVIALLITRQTWGYPCGRCECNNSLYTLSCVGRNVNALPLLNNTLWIRHAYIANTSISDVTLLSTFSNLYSTEIFLNEFLDCSFVLQLHNIPRLSSDCLPVKKRVTQSTESVYDWLDLLTISPLILILAFVVYLKKELNKFVKQILQMFNFTEAQTLVSGNNIIEESVA